MIRAAGRTPRTWGASVGFEICPELLDRLVDGFAGPWLPLAESPRPDDAAEPYDCVIIAARTPADVRRAVPLAGLLPRARRVRLVIAEVPPWAAQPVPVPGHEAGWCHLSELRIGRTGTGWWCDARFAEPVAGGEVLVRIAHGLFGVRRHMTQPVVALSGDAAARWRPGDANATLCTADGPVPERRDAPACDIVLRTTPLPLRPETGGGAPVVDRDAGGPAEGPDHLPPVDEAVINPIGFRSHPSLPCAALTESAAGYAIACGAETLVRIPPSGELTDADVARLRDARGVTVPALPGRPVAAARIVAALCAAGVPVLAAADPARDALLGAELAALLEQADPDRLASDLCREVLSIRLRRCALRRHGAVARWRTIVSATGLAPPLEPTVSILLCTRRPEMIPFAIRQMEAQRGVRAELILGLHGVPARQVAAGSVLLPITVVEAPAEMPFGQVLNRMAAAASGAFLAKVDDDDWYGPDHLADLVLAQLYSGADLVGSAAEFVYLEPIDVTIRRAIATERYAPLVAGGTILITRAMFDAVGGFRPLARTVDGQLLQAVRAAGGRIYRTHGFNYVLRRRYARGHTWQQPLPAFLTSYEEQWRGLVFTELMERQTVLTGGQR